MARLMTLEEAQRDRGRQEGIQIGRQQGLQEGRCRKVDRKQNWRLLAT